MKIILENEDDETYYWSHLSCFDFDVDGLVVIRRNDEVVN